MLIPLSGIGINPQSSSLILLFTVTYLCSILPSLAFQLNRRQNCPPTPSLSPLESSSYGLSDFGIQYTLCPPINRATADSDSLTANDVTLNCQYGTDQSSPFSCTFDAMVGSYLEGDDDLCSSLTATYADMGGYGDGTNQFSKCPKLSNGDDVNNIVTAISTMTCYYPGDIQCQYETGCGTSGDFINPLQCSPQAFTDLYLSAGFQRRRLKREIVKAGWEGKVSYLGKLKNLQRKVPWRK